MIVVERFDDLLMANEIKLECLSKNFKARNFRGIKIFAAPKL